MKYISVIGMEIHAELKTKSKMFCGCKNDLGLEKKPNTNICPVCTGQPGALPTPNKEAIRFVHTVGLALSGKIRLVSKFDRKNYFYPDLPKGYQISQYDEPLVERGRLFVGEREVGITRIHLEEDTGKSQHSTGNGTLVDLNRSGVPLMELVTEPEVESAREARQFCQNLQRVLRYLEVSDADMEKGQMRCEANISLYCDGEDRLSGTKVEVKNLNSFRVVEKAALYEIDRQEKALRKGEKIIQETRGWDENRQATVSQRAKESAHDYRYFPEPDIPPLEFSKEYVEDLRRHLPEMPAKKSARFQEEYGVSSANAETLVEDKYFADFVEQVISELKEKKRSGELVSDEARAVKLAFNYALTELRKHIATSGEDIRAIKITAENYAELVALVADGKINSSAAQVVLQEMYARGGDPSNIIAEKNLAQMNDDGEISAVVEKVLAENEQSVADFRAGKENALQYLVGQVMRETKGKANPGAAAKILREKMER